MEASQTWGFHWLTLSTREKPEAVQEKLGGEFSETIPAGRFNQPLHVMHESGARVYFGSQRDDQPVVVDVPGEACEKAADKFVKLGNESNWRLTRYDVACDLKPDELARKRLIQMYQQWKRGKVETWLPKASVELIKNDREGEGYTIYFGSKKSDRFLRVYDRRGPLRMEFQQRVPSAVSFGLLDDLERRGPRGMWQSHAKRVMFPMQWYADLLSPDAPDLPSPDKKVLCFDEILMAVEQALGPTLHMLLLANFPLEKLARRPANVSWDFLMKWEAASRAAEDYGYDGDAIRRELKCLSKSRRR